MFEECLKFDDKDDGDWSEEKDKDGATVEDNIEHQLEHLCR